MLTYLIPGVAEQDQVIFAGVGGGDTTGVGGGDVEGSGSRSVDTSNDVETN